jgi:hypothetical protein
VFVKPTQGTNSSQTQQLYYTVTFNAIRFNCIESLSGLLQNRSSVSTFVVHCGITKAYNRWYSQCKSTVVKDLVIYTVECLKVRKIKVIHNSGCAVYLTILLYIVTILLYIVTILLYIVTILLYIVTILLYVVTILLYIVTVLTLDTITCYVYYTKLPFPTKYV